MFKNGEIKNYIDDKQFYPIIEKAIANSSHIVAAYDGDKIVGLIRSMDDDCWSANIDCCVVHKNYQNLGIGITMLKKLLKSIEHIENISVSPTTRKLPMTRLPNILFFKLFKIYM